LSDNKIANFEDYKNKAAKSKSEQVVKPEPMPESKPEPKPESKPETAPVSQDTMNIEIEDPYQFLNASEREEYILQRQKELMKEQGIKIPDDESEEEEYSEKDRHDRDRDYREEEDYPDEEDYPEDDEDYPEDDEDYPDEDEEDYPDDDDDYPDEDEDEDDDEEDDEERPSRGINMERLVRIASVITGLVILLFVALVLKNKVFDKYFAPDPDTAQTVTVAIPEGFTETNDTVVVMGASSLNLRSVPDASSKDTVVLQVPEGTELRRIAVSDAGNWALVEVEGQQLYGSMKYLTAK
jgi:hypothetical protein